MREINSMFITKCRAESKLKALQKPCEDTISREDALMCMTGEYIADMTYKPEDIISKHIQRLRALPPVQPIYNASEWCHDCSEYDHDKHCCPRFNKVIRNAVKEIKQPKTGHWIEGQTDNPNIHNILCSCCCEGYPSKGHANSQYTREKFKYCPNCGATMLESQESEK